MLTIQMLLNDNSNSLFNHQKKNFDKDHIIDRIYSRRSILFPASTPNTYAGNIIIIIMLLYFAWSIFYRAYMNQNKSLTMGILTEGTYQESARENERYTSYFLVRNKERYDVNERNIYRVFILLSILLIKKN